MPPCVASAEEVLKEQVRTSSRAVRVPHPFTTPSSMLCALCGLVRWLKDFSRTVLAVHVVFDRANGERWLLTDTVYGWWDLASAWGEEGKQEK